MSARPGSRPVDPGVRRLALAPGLLAVVALLVGVLLIESEAFLVIRFAVSVLALIMIVFAVQARHWWWTPPLAAIAVLWNPVLPVEVPEPWWLGAHYLAMLVVVLAGVLVKVPVVKEGRGSSR